MPILLHAAVDIAGVSPVEPGPARMNRELAAHQSGVVVAVRGSVVDVRFDGALPLSTPCCAPVTAAGWPLRCWLSATCGTCGASR